MLLGPLGKEVWMGSYITLTAYYDPTIKFTWEVEEDWSLPFLDTRVTRKEDSKLDVTVYHKQMHTDIGLTIQHM